MTSFRDQAKEVLEDFIDDEKGKHFLDVPYCLSALEEAHKAEIEKAYLKGRVEGYRECLQAVHSGKVKENPYEK